MKITKIVKYNYKLTEETLEKDIDSFILEAREGKFAWDYKHNSEGLKIIRQYFKILQEKFENRKYGECKICYGKLILFLIDASIGENNANFGYEDLLSKVSKNFDEYVKHYFICMVNTCEIEELAERVTNYAVKLLRAGYEFDLGIQILLNKLDKNTLNNLEQRMVVKTEGMTKKDENKKDIIYFLMSIAEIQKDKEKYLRLCEKFKGILNEKEYKILIDEYGGPILNKM